MSSSSGSPKQQCQPQLHNVLQYTSRLVDVSDGDGSDEELHRNLPVTTGNLNKWTNMLHGWQERYFVLKDGVLSYFRSADDIAEGCRGAIRLKNAQVQPHPYDDCRIDVSLGDSTWYFRCPSPQSRRHWVDCIEKHRLAESGYSSEQALTTQSSLSLNSITSASNLRCQSLLDKVAEIESFRTVLNQQSEKLQAYLETCHRITQQAEDAGGYEQLLDPEMFEETLSQLHGKLSSLRKLPRLSLEKTPQQSFDEPPVDCYDERDSLASDESSEELVMATPCAKDSMWTRGRSSTDAAHVCTAESAPSLFFNGQSPPTTPPPDDDLSMPSPESGDEGAKTPKATNINSRGIGIGFLSRFLPFNKSNAANAHQATSPANANNLNRSKAKSAPEPLSLLSSRMHDFGVLLSYFGALSIDFGMEVDLLKSTFSALQVALNQTVEIFNHREDKWQRRYDREVEKRRNLERQLKLTQETLAASRTNPARRGIRLGPGKAHQRSHSHGGQQSLYGNQLFPHLGAPVLGGNTASCGVPDTSTGVAKLFIVEEGGPDFAEGGSEYTVNEERFYDAVDAQLDKLHQDEACLMALKSVGDKLRSADAMPSSHPLYPEVAKVCEDRIGILRDGFPSFDGEVGSVNNGWTVLAKQGKMTIYNREVESSDGTYLDPLQAVHTVYNITAREMSEAFWDVQYRLDWEITVDQAPTVLEVCGEDTVVQYQVYKRIWPATQRDSLFWSHIRRLDTQQFPQDGAVTSEGLIILDTWMVVNYSTKYGEDRLPPSAKTPSFIRLEVDVEMFCQTLWQPPNPDFDVSTLPNAENLRSLSPEEQQTRWEAVGVTRDSVRCRLLYASQINPGGWAPATVVRTMARREYPHFLQRISDFALARTVGTTPKF
ncbi:unnamed protein product [Hymenolepis diminuta]|uniref:Collagen type IV alpha-3-binding protein n=1 Tax=Hymenolepis diminuta TaxID=6216 RepID=A0A564Y9C2_HYMDI|nr:unnamed protein product [Hymenolepis diminuta]